MCSSVCGQVSFTSLIDPVSLQMDGYYLSLEDILQCLVIAYFTAREQEDISLGLNHERYFDSDESRF